MSGDRLPLQLTPGASQGRNFELLHITARPCLSFCQGDTTFVFKLINFTFMEKFLIFEQKLC